MSDNMKESFARIELTNLHGEAFTEEGEQCAGTALWEIARALEALTSRLREKAPTITDLYTVEDENGEEYREGTIELAVRDNNGNVLGMAIIGLTERPD